MHDLVKAIKGLECCHVMVHNMGPEKSSCGSCPYRDVQTEEQINLGGIECIAVLHDDVLALLKEQTPKKMFLVDENGHITPLPDVVRCKDCKHGYYCKQVDKFDCNIPGGTSQQHVGSWFCADGERR